MKTTTELGTVQVSKTKKGEYVRRLIKGQPSETVYVRGGYDKSSKRFSLHPVDDMNREVFIAGSKLVQVGFTY